MSNLIIHKFIKILIIIWALLLKTSAEEGENHGENTSVPHEKGGSGTAEDIGVVYISRLPYLEIPTIVVPIIKKGELFGSLIIKPELKGKDDESYHKLRSAIVSIKDELFCDLFYAMSRLWLGPEPPSPVSIKNRIRKKVNAFLKEDVVERVILHFIKLSLSQNGLKAMRQSSQNN